MARNLKTGWVIIATSGNTVDGRKIDKDWLEDMAASYNPSLYSAKLWPDHYRFMNNGGSVLALKTEPATTPGLEGETHLMAIIAPNDWLIEANRQGQYVHTSIEVAENFMGKGHFYLEGLGVTDYPASAGTSELRFNKRRQHPDNHIFAGEQINTCTALAPQEPGVIARLFGTSTPHQPDDETMNEQQFKALQDSIKSDMQALFSSLKDELKTPDDVADAPTAEQYAALAEQNTELKERLDKLETQFTQLQNTPAPGTQTPEGEGDAAESVI